MKTTSSPIIIGRCDVADFPLLAIKDIAIKIDTGAYTSSIHCKDIQVKENKLHCVFLDPEHPEYNGKSFVFDQFKQKKVKSSNGQVQLRYLIKTRIRLFEQEYPIELTLSDREEMNFPILIGRKFLTHRFIVDVSKENLSKLNKPH
ncbi:ATP-dependent zinc protease [uncultured Mesonia sp.]|uniref:ATP-dependent zinc protease family protein n=1 Tax=uncultured Mesonia sp. TaxID=399731 RepID=UPI00374EB07A